MIRIMVHTIDTHPMESTTSRRRHGRRYGTVNVSPVPANVNIDPQKKRIILSNKLTLTVANEMLLNFRTNKTSFIYPATNTPDEHSWWNEDTERSNKNYGIKYVTGQVVLVSSC